MRAPSPLVGALVLREVVAARKEASAPRDIALIGTLLRVRPAQEGMLHASDVAPSTRGCYEEGHSPHVPTLVLEPLELPFAAREIARMQRLRLLAWRRDCILCVCTGRRLEQSRFPPL